MHHPLLQFKSLGHFLLTVAHIHMGDVMAQPGQPCTLHRTQRRALTLELDKEGISGSRQHYAVRPAFGAGWVELQTQPATFPALVHQIQLYRFLALLRMFRYHNFFVQKSENILKFICKFKIFSLTL